MKIAIIGAGLSGLSIAWHLIESGCSVTVFDPKGIGGGASGIAAGLMHPYPGEQGRRSFLATEGMAATRRLLKIAQEKCALPLANEMGIIRYPHKPELSSLFSSHMDAYKDVEPCDTGFLIRSGMTIFCRRYLEALWTAISERGGILKQQKISQVHELDSYDHVVLAAGAGIVAFPEAEALRIELLKGQILTCRMPQDISFPEQSLIGKGYIAHAGEEGVCHLGSTYERGELSEDADLTKAMTELLPKAASLYPPSSSFTILDCRAGFRVMRIGHYYPIAARLKDNLWICSAMGSRGLLYHGIIGEYMKEAILQNNAMLLPKEFSF